MKSLREIEAEIIEMEGGGKTEKAPPRHPTKPIKPQNDSKIGLIGSEVGPLSEKIQAGLRLLTTRPPPRFQDESAGKVWPQIVSDAQGLAKPDPVAGYSMADRAIQLGWDAKDLFGFWSEWQSWDDWCSLAVWVQGRTPLVIGERTACLSFNETSQSHYDRLQRRPALDEIKYLWEI